MSAISLIRAAAFGTVLLFSSAAAAVAQSTTPVPVAHFFEKAPFNAARLSPSGKYLAVRVGGNGKRDSLAVIDLATDQAKGVAAFSDVDIDDFQWVNNDRLLFDTIDRELPVGQLDRAPGMYAVNRDGANMMQLVLRKHEESMGRIESKLNRVMLPYNTYMRAQSGPQDSDYVYVEKVSFNGYAMPHYVDLQRLNTQNGTVKTVPRPDHTQQWLLDHKGEPRIAIAYERNMTTIHYRDPGNDTWRALVSFDMFKGSADSFKPVAFGPDGTLYVQTRAGKDKSAIHTFNFTTGKINPDALIVTADYDFEGELISGRDKLLGMRVTTDTESTMWFDDKMKALQKTVDDLLPTTVNLVAVPARPETPWVLIEAYSDTTPRTFLLFNSETKQFSKIGSTKPNIDPKRMGRQQMVRYQARDGLSIPAWLTLPPGGKNSKLPLVVLVHGGPFARGHSWGWDAETQFLASRGYAVLAPEFRGSTGYGYKHFRAGWKQWGLAMQDDLADGVKWAVGKGLVDPERVCIAGASYGGYATLMGLVRDPAMYKCGINWVGVTDINLMYTEKWNFESDLSSSYRQYGMPEMVGDPVKDKEQLRETSPLVQAAKVTRPVLLAYGTADRRVPVYHGEKFFAAVKGSNPQAEYISYPDEGHGWRLLSTQLDFWTRVEKFLERHIGKP